MSVPAGTPTKRWCSNSTSHLSLAAHLKASSSKPAPRDQLGCVTHESSTALILIDVINRFDFPEADRLLRFAHPAARCIATLKKKLRARGIPAIYVNDNFGLWKSDFHAQVEQSALPGCPGSEIVKLLRPEADDYFVLKPKHSGFFSTPLQVLLNYLGARRLILTGFAGNICILYTANDAYMRDYELFVPEDCMASETEALNHRASEHMETLLRADVRRSDSRSFLRAATRKK